MQLVRKGTDPLTFDQSQAPCSAPADLPFLDGPSFTRQLHSERRTPHSREDEGIRYADVVMIVQLTLA